MIELSGVGLFKILFEDVGFQMFLEDGQGLCCPSFREKMFPSLWCQNREELSLGVGAVLPKGWLGQETRGGGVLVLGCRVLA